MDLKTITVLWLDDREETYSGVATTVRDGALHIHQYTGITHTLQAEWHIPLASIRLWFPAGQERPSRVN